jgi:hypothetical protein
MKVVKRRMERAKKTPPVPAPAARTPAPAGKMNCPNLFPIKRVETARARSSGLVASDTKDMVNG